MVSKFSLSLLIGLVLILGDVQARGGGGGRGGGGRGGGRGGRSSSRGGSSGRSLSTYTASGIAVYGATRYTYGYGGYRGKNSNAEPTICENTNRKAEFNGTAFFICPMENSTADMFYCCGDSGKEHCCGYWDDGGRVAGAVIGFICLAVAVIICGMCLYKCFCKSDARSSHSDSPSPSNVKYTPNVGSPDDSHLATGKGNNYVDAPDYNSATSYPAEKYGGPDSNSYGVQPPTAATAPPAYTYPS